MIAGARGRPDPSALVRRDPGGSIFGNQVQTTLEWDQGATKIAKGFCKQGVQTTLKLEPLIAAKAKEKERERKTTFQKSEKSNLPKHDTVKELARIAGVSHDTIAKVKVWAIVGGDAEAQRRPPVSRCNQALRHWHIKNAIPPLADGIQR